MSETYCRLGAMLAYPKELRIRVVNAIENGDGTIAEISTLFGVGPTFIKKMLRWHRAGEDLAPRHGGGPVALLQEPERALLRQEVAKQPDVTLEELQSRLAALRHIALNLLRQDKSTKMGMQNRRLTAGWDETYLAKLVFG